MVKQKEKGARSSFEGRETGVCSVCLRSDPELERIKQQYSLASCWVLYFLNLIHRPTQTLVSDFGGEYNSWWAQWILSFSCWHDPSALRRSGARNKRFLDIPDLAITIIVSSHGTLHCHREPSTLDLSGESELVVHLHSPAADCRYWTRA